MDVATLAELLPDDAVRAAALSEYVDR